MSYTFGKKSHRELCTTDARLQDIAHKVLRIKDHSIIQGHRNHADQIIAYRDGFSKVQWPNGKHNGLPSKAMDVQTYPRPQKPSELREEQFYLLGLYRGVAHEMGLEVRTGADWDNDGEVSDNGWDDLFHVELRL